MIKKENIPVPTVGKNEEWASAKAFFPNNGTSGATEKSDVSLGVKRFIVKEWLRLALQGTSRPGFRLYLAITGAVLWHNTNILLLLLTVNLLY